MLPDSFRDGPAAEGGSSGQAVARYFEQSRPQVAGPEAAATAAGNQAVENGSKSDARGCAAEDSERDSQRDMDTDSIATEFDDTHLQEALHEWHQHDIDVVDVILIMEEEEDVVKD